MVSSGLVVLRRPANFPPEDIICAGGLSPIDARAAYRGMEGEAWPDPEAGERFGVRHGFAPIDSFPEVYTYVLAMAETVRCDLLFLGSHSPSISLPSEFAFCGYEFGNYVSEFNHFSCVFNEIICGRYAPLTDYVRDLNSSLLFESAEQAENFATTRQRLVCEGADLEVAEPDEPFEVIAVFGLRRTLLPNSF